MEKKLLTNADILAGFKDVPFIDKAEGAGVVRLAAPSKAIAFDVLARFAKTGDQWVIVESTNPRLVVEADGKTELQPLGIQWWNDLDMDSTNDVAEHACAVVFGERFKKKLGQACQNFAMMALGSPAAKSTSAPASAPGK